MLGALRVDELGPGEPAADGTDRIGALFAGDLDLVVWRGLFTAEQLLSVYERRAALEPPFPYSVFPTRQKGQVWGRCLDLADDLPTYFREAEQMRLALRSAFAPLDFEATLATALSHLAGQRPTSRLETVEGRGFMPVTLRAFPTDGFIPAHCEQEHLDRGPSLALAALIDVARVLSFSIMVAPAETGGRLVLHDLRWEEIDASRITANGHSRVRDLLAQRKATPVGLAPGDLAVFDGGRRYHSVERVGGERLRATFGGFVSPTKDGRALCYWS